MSLPSVAQVAQEFGVDLSTATPEEQEKVLVQAMRRDLPNAIAYLHQKAHEADSSDGSVLWVENPNSVLGKELIRIHASDALRPLASKHFCHDKPLTFVNCCVGVVGPPPKNLLALQIECQAGPTAFADC